MFGVATYEFVAELVDERDKERKEQEELIRSSIPDLPDNIAENSEDSPLSKE